jgi:hypothetical protein
MSVVDDHLARTFTENMKEEPDQADSSLSETMARIEINEIGDAARESEIVDAVLALDGVIETKVEKGALYVSRSARHE